MAAVAATAPAPADGQHGAALNRSHPFTCVTCAIAFRSSKMQRDHMRSDWHRYNLKRRVASLPPLSSEIFADKVLSAQASSSAAAAKASFEKNCSACQKTYYSENAFQNHLGSQKHRMKVMSLDQEKETEPSTPSMISSTISLGDPVAPENVEDPEVEAEFIQVVKGMKDANLQNENGDEDGRPSRPHHSSNDEEKSPRAIAPSTTPSSVATQTSGAMPLTRCLFCNYDSPTFKLSLMHMTKYHAMFVPEQDYLIDVEGLVQYLQAKVTENFECLFCHKLKNSTGGVQTHMRDKGHTMIAFDSEEEMLEIGQFYDFRSTYSDSEDDASSTSTAGPKASKASKLGAKRDGLKSGAEAGADRDDEDGNEEGWETDSDYSVDSDEIGSVPLGKNSVYRQAALARYRRDPRSLPGDGMHTRAYDRHAAYRDGHELHLPSGRTAGHRSLARYYRQNLHNYPTAAERAEQQQRLLEAGENGEAEGGAESQRNRRQVVSRANGGLGMLGVSDATRRHVAALAQKQVRRAQRSEDQNRWGIQRRANNQKHFRDDNYGIRL